MPSRREFLRGDINGNRSRLYPPWAVNERLFTERCSRCGECIKVCPTNILKKGDGGFPVVDFRRGECDFCAECVTHCDTGALIPSSPAQAVLPWVLRPVISEHCLARNRVICRSCAEQCEQMVIRFRPGAGGISSPQINAERCTGCGACIRPCPVGAVSLISQQGGRALP